MTFTRGAVAGAVLVAPFWGWVYLTYRNPAAGAFIGGCAAIIVAAAVVFSGRLGRDGWADPDADAEWEEAPDLDGQPLTADEERMFAELVKGWKA